MIRVRSKHELDEPIPTLEQQRAEKLAQMGAQLWTSRLEQGMTLDEMVILTRIPRRLLQAIEEGNLDDLPEPIYTQGLIRLFANALGYSGAEFSSSFPVGSNHVSLKPSWKTRSITQLRPFHLYLLYVFLIFCSVSSLSGLLKTATWQSSSNQSKQIQALKIQNQPQLQANTFAEPFIPPTKLQEIQNNESQFVQIGLTLKQKSWIRVVADGKIQYEGELPEGTHRIWKAQENLTVKAGNAGGVLVSVNKEQAKQMGEPGMVKEMTIAAANTKL